jgi:colanic acid/amylovoran biosynthesis glycosyltransferase
MKLVYVTTMLPFGPGEGFLVPEVSELAKTAELTIVPMHPRGPLLHRDMLRLRPLVVEEPLCSVSIVGAALAEAARAPGRVLRLLVMLLGSRSARLVAKNLLVLPKGLWLGRYARRLGVEHIHAHWASTPSTMGMVAAETAGIPWSFTAHRWDIAEDNLLARKLRAACFARAISEQGAAALRAAVKNARIRVIHVGVDVADARTPARREPVPLNVVVAANLVEVKGHVYLLRALARLHREGAAIHLDVIGDGVLRDSLQQTTATLGVRELVTFHGAVSHEDVLQRLRSGVWDVCVLPSIVTRSGEHEGIPVSLLEAMSAGVPVVATSTGAIPELLGDGAGVLVPPSDPDALAEALAMLAGDPEAREALGRRGPERVEREFDVRATTERLLAEMGRCSGKRG